MNKQTRQRIIGAILLLVLAAVLSPLVFRSPEQIRAALNMEIPPAPDYQPVVVEPVVAESVEEAARERIDNDREAVAAAASDPGKTPPESGESDQAELESLTAPPVPAMSADDDPVLAGFVVQLASFSQADSADKLVGRLKEAGFRAYTETDSHDGKLVHRVMVGPEIRKEDAQRTRQRLADDPRFKMDGLVRIYAP